MADSLAVSAGKLVDVLTPLDSEQRLRVVEAALTLLGERFTSKASSGARTSTAADTHADDVGAFTPAVQAWLKKSGLEAEQLEHYFHFDGGSVQPIALPGQSKKKSDQTGMSYLAAGLASFLRTGDSGFTDEEARKLCEHFGCYDVTNHSKSVKALGNKVTGSKSVGWKLTQPGLTHIAQSIKASAGS
ncbi:hypothetical protein [Bordetella petrii]|uniref:Uncharacterized protein n=1 Tax=Bordetella petrii TaxID=94624 RepID=A0ABT7W814_9BORD|nr:hypothetical protein [Bordetella petrii]MDM9561319.1 hypothetical protein [Bordetella petrii]